VRSVNQFFTRTAIFTAALLCALIAGMTPRILHAADAAAEAIEGAWIVSVGSERKERFLIVRGARSEQGKIVAQSVNYAYLEARDFPVKEWNCEVVGDEIRLRFVTVADSVATLTKRFDEDTTSGTIVYKNGRAQTMRLTRVPFDEMQDLRAVAKLEARPATKPARPHANSASQIYLVYVSAPDCPSCRGYEAEYFGRKDLMAKFVPDFPKIKYIKSVLATYKSRDLVSTLPPELQWMKNMGPDGRPLIQRRGVPFFALVVDDRIWVQGHGTTGLETLLAPEIKRAVEEKFAAR
jgi:hypothetical protein